MIYVSYCILTHQPNLAFMDMNDETNGRIYQQKRKQARRKGFGETCVEEIVCESGEETKR